MPSSSPEPLVRPLNLLLRPQPARVVLRPYVPADNGGVPGTPSPPRVRRILDRVLVLDADTLAAETARVLTNLLSRHRDVECVLQRRFYDLVEQQAAGCALTPDQALLAGAYFVEEYSFEAAALFNPSIVAHPDQSGIDPGTVRIVLSLRGVGEGHISSIIFRTGKFSTAGGLVLDPPSRLAASPQIEFIPGGAPDDPGVRLYFGEHEDLSELVIFPVTLRQRHGIEDLRLVRFTEDDGHVTWFGTYTAFSGEAIRQELLRTRDFVGFELNALRGAITRTKGMALFPRRVGGRYAMLGRQDHENIWLLRSNDLYQWDTGEIVISPRWPWEFIQIGNSSPPIEIDEGWLVITHGVGAVRNYCLGACLLDKKDPSRLLARTARPLIRPSEESRDGYVPNVAYSCGALALGRTLLLPYGVADSFTAFATVSINTLVAGMT
ncbi:glycosidase [Sphingomonas spermidinifaciens]|uniref:Glycosidase n=1 Tax=Sphingomonas spermidinifaciens TaxID=1141889 RepID=A0A2A4B2H2_9SPHN|nr:glycoside hydrolase family 130 protein [Sphingomonas spermidinifaciens]PCD02165.1 glycosidase [Sphingomonas spermidinifaciens]